MAIRGKIIRIGTPFSGVSSAGKEWKRQEFVLETAGQYPKKVAFSLMNDRIDKAQIQLGHEVEIEVDADSREYNGKWYTTLTAWRINNHSVIAPQNTYQQTAPNGYTPASPQMTVGQLQAQQQNNNDDLAF